MFKQILSALFGDHTPERTYPAGSSPNTSARTVHFTSHRQQPIARPAEPADHEDTGQGVTFDGEVSSLLNDVSRCLGLLGVLGESEYQRARSAARSTSLDEAPVFMARLIPGAASRREAGSIKVVIEGFGQIGYLPFDSVAGYGSRITVEPAVRCPVQLRGAAPAIAAIIDLARSEGARLTAWRPEDEYDYEAHARFHTMRQAVLETLQHTRAIEHSDLETAISRYRAALQGVREYERFALEHRLFALTRPGSSPRSVEVLDRLTVCLVRAERRREAVEEADRYFAEFRPDASSRQVQAITARLVPPKTARCV